MDCQSGRNQTGQKRILGFIYMAYFYDFVYRVALSLRVIFVQNHTAIVTGKTAVISYDEGWCISGAARDIMQHWKTDYQFCTLDYVPNDAEYYFVAYYTMLPRLYMQYPWLTKRKVIVKMAHAFDAVGEDDIPRFSGQLFGYLFNHCALIFNQASLWERYIVKNWGVNADLIYTNNDGVDTTMFTGHKRTGKGKILISAGGHPRKRPELLYEVMKELPHKEFLILMGGEWEESPHYEKIKSLPNVKFIKVPYQDYPKYYAKCDVYLSTSILEGGPIPLVESMAENMIPVMPRTGMADDLIRHGDNGYIFELDDNAKTIASYIEQAYENKSNTRADVIHLDWRDYSLRLQERIGIK